jgi:tetratricopeptide (TPR) repeat protein
MMWTEMLAQLFHISISTPVDAYTRIEEWLETALPLFPDNIHMQILDAWMVTFNQYRWKEGLDKLDQALALAKGDALALTMLGYAYGNLAEQELAIELLERSQQLDPDSPHNLYGLGYLYPQAGRQDEALALPQPIGYDYFNAVNSATMNVFLQRSAEIDQSIRKAKKYVSANHPTIRSLESQWLNVKGEKEAALVIEHELIDNMREDPITVGWVAPVRHEALVIAEEQRQSNPLQWILLAKGQGWPMSEDLKPFLEKMNIDEMPERKRGRSQHLNQAEQDAILSNAISVPVSKLQSYAGVYRSGDNYLEIFLDQGQLKYQGAFTVGRLSAVTENTFTSTNERDFSVEILANEAGEYDLCIWRDGQWVHYGYRMNSDLAN